MDLAQHIKGLLEIGVVRCLVVIPKCRLVINPFDAVRRHEGPTIGHTGNDFGKPLHLDDYYVIPPPNLSRKCSETGWDDNRPTAACSAARAMSSCISGSPELARHECACVAPGSPGVPN